MEHLKPLPVLGGSEVLHDYMPELTVKRKLLSAANAQLPINCLPSEVLLEVLLTARDFMDDHRQPWHELLLVCKLWYELSVDFPIFWARLKINHNRHITKSRLRLSKNAPLSVYHQDLPYSRADVNEFAKTLGDDVYRVETLIYHGWTLSDKIESIIPSAKTLDITFLDKPLWGPRLLHLPPEAPLRYLFLDRVTLDYSSQCLRNLVKLSLCRLHYFPPSLSDIIRIVESSPGLNLLHLQDIRTSDDISESSKKLTAPLQMHYLGYLVLRDIPGSISEAILFTLVPHPPCCLVLEQVDLKRVAPFIRGAFEHVTVSRLHVEIIVCDHKGPAKGQLVNMIVAATVAPRIRIQAMPKQLNVVLQTTLDQLRVSKPSLLIDLQFVPDPESVNGNLEAWLSSDIIAHLDNVQRISVDPRLDGSLLVDSLGTRDGRAKYCSRLESLLVDGNEKT